MVALAYALLSVILSLGVQGNAYVDGAAEVLAALAAGAFCTQRAIRERQGHWPARDQRAAGRDAIAWSLLAAGAYAWAAGQGGCAMYQLILHRGPAGISWLSFCLLSSSVLLASGVVAMMRTPAGYLSIFRAIAESIFTSAGVFLLTWTLVIAPVVAAGRSSGVGNSIDLAYPLIDVVALSAALSVIYWREDDPPRGLGLLAIGIVGITVADAGFWLSAETRFHFTWAPPFRVAWVIGFLLVAAAASRSQGTMASVRSRPRYLLLALPLIPPALGAVVLILKDVLAHDPGSGGSTLLIAATILSLAVALMFALVYEDGALRDDLRRRIDEHTAGLRKAESYYRAMVEHTSDLTIVLDADFHVTNVSSSVRDMLGLEEEDLMHRHIGELTSRGRETLADALSESLRDPSGSRRVEWELTDPSHRVRRFESTITNLLDDPSVTGIVLNTRDVTERLELEEQLRHHALHDPLTGLPNRVLLSDRLDQALARSLRSGLNVAVIVVGLNGFKDVNESLGSAVADDLLRQIGMRLDAEIRPHDTAARTGGDEFVLLFDAIRSGEDVMKLAERTFAIFDRPFSPGTGDHRVGASVGIAMGSGADSDPSRLLSEAESAMRAVKAGGKGRAFESAAGYGDMERLRLQTELTSAIERGELRLMYQPQVRTLDPDRAKGFEALIRWNHPTLGVLGPGRFIPIAEQCGAIGAVGRWALKTAVARATIWQSEGAATEIAVNVSPLQLKDPGFLGDVQLALAEADLDPGRLVLEITESCLIEEADATVRVLAKLRELGVRIAIDDFGSGYASLGYLAQLPIDIIKLDRSFIAETDERGRELLASIIEMGKRLSLETLIEGVETIAQFEFASEIGCEVLQGFLFGRPLPPGCADELVRGGALNLPQTAAVISRPTSWG